LWGLAASSVELYGNGEDVEMVKFGSCLEKPQLDIFTKRLIAHWRSIVCECIRAKGLGEGHQAAGERVEENEGP